MPLTAYHSALYEPLAYQPAAYAGEPVTPEDVLEGAGAFLITRGLLSPWLLTRGLGATAFIPPPPEPSEDLLAAIWTHADGDPHLTALFGGEGWLWKVKAGRGSPLPYAVVFETGTARVGLTTSEEFHENVGIQFNVFAASELQAKRLGKAVQDAFSPHEDQVALVFEDGVDMWRWLEDGNVLELDDDPGPDGEDVYVQRINFAWRIGRVYQPA